MSGDDEATARERGRQAGADPNAYGGDCPYSHSDIDLRMAWMTGFGEGRASIKAVARTDAPLWNDEPAPKG